MTGTMRGWALALAALVVTMVMPTGHAAVGPGAGGGGGGSVTGSYSFSSPLVLSGTSVSLPLEIANLKTNKALTNYSGNSFQLSSGVLQSLGMDPRMAGVEFYDDFDRDGLTNYPGTSPSGHVWGHAPIGTTTNLVFIKDGEFRHATNGATGPHYWGVTRTNLSVNWSWFGGTVKYRGLANNGFEDNATVILCRSLDFNTSQPYLHYKIGRSWLQIQLSQTNTILNENFVIPLTNDVFYTFNCYLMGNRLVTEIGNNRYEVTHDSLAQESITNGTVLIYEHNRRMTNLTSGYYASYGSAWAGAAPILMQRYLVGDGFTRGTNGGLEKISFTAGGEQRYQVKHESDLFQIYDAIDGSISFSVSDTTQDVSIGAASSGNVNIVRPLVYNVGTPGVGKVLTDADGSGTVAWADATGGSGGGTNNPVLIEGPQVTLIANQTARSQISTNQPFTFSIIGASNYSSRAQFFVQNTSPSTIIYVSNAVTTLSVKDGSNVTAFAVPPGATLELNLSLNASNQWVARADTKEYQLVPDGTTVTGTYDHAAGTYTLTATAAAGATNYTSLNVSNVIRRTITDIIITNTDPFALNLASGAFYRVKALTNATLRVTNNFDGFTEAYVSVQQDTNGGWPVHWELSGGVLKTNSTKNYNGNTNANAESSFTIRFANNATNLQLLLDDDNLQPRTAFTNSLAGGTATLPLELTTTPASGAYSVARKLTNAWTGALALVVRSSDSATNYLVPSGIGNNISAILSWAGTDSVYVTNLFDQTGNGRHLLQGNTNLCFVIATNGTAVSKSGITAMKRIGANAGMTALSVALSEPVSGIVTVYNEGATASDIIVGGGGTTRQIVKQLSTTAYRLNNGSNADIGATTADQWDILTYKFLVTASDADAIAVDGGSYVTGEAGSNAATSLNIGSETVGADMMIIDWIIWNADVDDGELGLVRDNINAYESIY